MAVLICKMCGAENTVKSISLSYSEDDFTLVENADGLTEIYSIRHSSMLGTDTLDPAIPLIPIKVAVPSGMTYRGFDVEETKTLLGNGIVMSILPAYLDHHPDIILNSTNIYFCRIRLTEVLE